MNINDTAEQAAFRREVQDWIANEVPAQLKGLRQAIVQGPGLTDEELKPLFDALGRKGWQAPSWPTEYGGAGFGIAQMVIFSEEFAKAGVPEPHSSGLSMLGPILIAYGTEAQKERYLGPILRNEEKWAQGYSEPQAGSDLASLQLRCDVMDDHFLLNGQKIWTSGAHKSEMLFMLVRTDAKAERRQDGISFLLVDRKSPGIDPRPIITIDGFHHFNEVFFDNVKVPKENLVGELGKGWTVAKALLGHERFSHPTSDPTVMVKAINNVKDSARNVSAGDGVMWDNAQLKREVAQLEMDADCMRYTRYRALTKAQQGEAPGPETMIFKQFGAELNQRIVSLHQQVEGPLGVLWDDTVKGDGLGETGRHACNIRAATLRGGTSEVQRNIVSKRVLGLPD